MDLLTEMAGQRFTDAPKKSKNDTVCIPSTSFRVEEELIDLSKLNFLDDESWLLEFPNKSDIDLYKWLYDSGDLPQNDQPNKKNIDTRTFTRPKRRFMRPSIEKYNEEFYGNNLKEQTNSEQHNGCISDDSSNKPLQFDLGQLSASIYFEKMLANAPMLDSFQNMSPPSLVNSMCSSTFANLMENSFIKNDPVLREIRDTDFTVSILQQETEPMFQSMTESFSSLSSDVPENFLKKMSHEINTTTKAITDNGARDILNVTFEKEPITEHAFIDNHYCDENLQKVKTLSDESLNNTFCQKSSTIKLNNTYKRKKDNTLNGNKTRSEREDLYATITIESNKGQLRDEKTMENIKRLLDRRPSPSLDLNRLSYIVEKNDQLNMTFNSTSVKRNSFGSTDSGENQDCMSLSSGSSKSSNKMLSIDGINAIVDMQERSLQQVMSTPKPQTMSMQLWPDNELSPISGRNSDPEMSSCEKPPKSRLSLSHETPIRKQRSVGHIGQRVPPPKNVHTVNRLQSAKTNIRGSQSNLRMAEAPTYRLRSSSNLNSMGHTLKGSYTSLKPMNPNLPVAPPPLDATMTVAKKPAAVPSVPREVEVKRQDCEFVKPQPPKVSGLARPATGIPRPATGIPRPVSRIPGPRNVRPISKSAGQQGRC